MDIALIAGRTPRAAAMQVYAKLSGVHKGQVTALLPMGSLEPGGPDRLISAGADGTIAVRGKEKRVKTYAACAHGSLQLLEWASIDWFWSHQVQSQLSN